jgi:hypothetical protein
VKIVKNPKTRKIPMSSGAMDQKILHGHGKAVRTDDIAQTDDNPVILALTPVEQDIWQQHTRGVNGKTIGEYLGLTKDRVCRILQIVRAKIHFLYEFRTILLTGRVCSLAKFLACECSSPCQKRGTEGCPMRGLEDAPGLVPVDREE